MVTVFASFYPKNDKTEEVRNILSAMVEPTRAESGNKTYDLFSMKSESNEETFHLFEIYDGKEALEFHRGTEHYKNYRANIVQHLIKPIEVKVLNQIKWQNIH